MKLAKGLVLTLLAVILGVSLTFALGKNQRVYVDEPSRLDTSEQTADVKIDVPGSGGKQNNGGDSSTAVSAGKQNSGGDSSTADSAGKQNSGGDSSAMDSAGADLSDTAQAAADAAADEGETKVVLQQDAKIAVRLDVPLLMQLPELPTGCESIALTMVLRYLDYSVEKTDIVNHYLDYSESDFVTAFVGSPYSEYGAGCYAPGLCKAADKFLTEKGDARQAVNLTGTAFDDLLDYLDKDVPVIVWNTEDLRELDDPSSACYIGGREYFFYNQEHCVVLCGYSADKSMLYVNDSLAGAVEREYKIFKARYEAMGSQAIVIE